MHSRGVGVESVRERELAKQEVHALPREVPLNAHAGERLHVPVCMLMSERKGEREGETGRNRMQSTECCSDMHLRVSLEWLSVIDRSRSAGELVLTPPTPLCSLSTRVHPCWCQ